MSRVGRLPFNPDLIAPRPAAAAPSPEGGAAGDRPMTVVELAERLKVALADHFPGKVRVVGEVSNFSSRAHWFFSLKDEGATIRCVCFASSARQVRCPVEDGMQVVCTGRIDFYDAQGHVQLYVDRIEPVGQGALELRLRQLMEELRGLGYFEAARKKPLPVLPVRVAVVTSRSGAALQDVIDTARRRWAGCRLYLCDVRVQGAGAAPEVARAIDALSRHHARLGIDAVILTRGGGSIEDLWAFNERAVAEAIYRCPLPVVAAIGHETDTTIAELVADQRCATPTQAVMQLIPDGRALLHQVDQLARRATLLTHRRLDHERHRLESAARQALFRRPRRLLEDAASRLASAEKRLRLATPRRVQPERSRIELLIARLEKAMPLRLKPAQERVVQLDCELSAALRRRVQGATQQTDALERQLGALNPHNVLQRGYSYTLGPDGSVLRQAADANPGDTLTTVLADGRVRSTVDGQTAQRLPGAPTPRPTRRRRRPSNNPDQPGLFGVGD